MISYGNFWKTMKEKGVTTYTLIKKYDVQSKTVYNLKHNKHVTTATLERLCEILECTPNEILEFTEYIK